MPIKEIPQILEQPIQIGTHAFNQEINVTLVGGKRDKFVNPRAERRIKKESAHTVGDEWRAIWKTIQRKNPYFEPAEGQVGEPKEVPDYLIRKELSDISLRGDKADLRYMTPQGDIRILNGIAGYYNEVVPHMFKSEVDPKRVVFSGPGKLFLNAIGVAAAQPKVGIKEKGYVGDDSAAGKSVYEYAHDGIEYGIVALPQPNGHFNIADAQDRLYTVKPGLLMFPEPGNHTPTTFNKEEKKLIVDFVKDHDALVVVDGVYNRYVYDGKKYDSLANSEIESNVIFIETPSKGWRGTSFRTGWAVFPEGAEALQEAVTHQLNDAYGPGCTPLGLAMLPAFTKEGDKATQAHIKHYENKRNVIREALDTNDFEHGPMEAAFYVQIKKPDCFKNTHEAGINAAINGLGLLPGQPGKEIDIYTREPINKDGGEWLRLSYGESEEKLVPAINNWGEAVRGRKVGGEAVKGRRVA